MTAKLNWRAMGDRRPADPPHPRSTVKGSLPLIKVNVRRAAAMRARRLTSLGAP